MNYNTMTVAEVQDFVKEHELRIVRGFPELKTNSKCLLISKTGDRFEVIKEDVNFRTRFIKYDPTDEKSWTPSGEKMITVFGKLYALHRLVAFTWLDEPTNEKNNLVWFKNGNRKDIRVGNLEWGSRSMSTKITAMRRKPRTFKGRWCNGKYTSPDHEVIEMTREEYLKMIEKERGHSYAHKLELDRKAQQNRSNKAQTTNVDCAKKNH